MTYDENARYLANSDCRTSLLDPIQFIPLGQSENYYLSFGFWIRERGEFVNNPNWSDQPSGNAYMMQRYFLHMDPHLGEPFRHADGSLGICLHSNLHRLGGNVVLE